MNTELQDTQAGVIKSKIMELQSALFFTESSSIVKLPTHIIPDVEVDSEGRIWFVIPKPVQHIDAFDKEIPAKLDFFKKGKDFFVKVRGTAHLITDVSEIENVGLSQQMMERMQNDQVIAVKISVLDAELIDNTPKPAQNWLKSSRTQLSSWFF